jgi:hypothetical protein
MCTLHFVLNLQMSMEFQVPSPLVPTRESYFVRYCKHNPDGTWAVVDVSLDSLRPSPVVKCRRRPSGCIIQELPNGYSKVRALSVNVVDTVMLTVDWSSMLDTSIFGCTS